MATRVLVTGDRGWDCRGLAKRVMARLVERYGHELVIVHGAARGVDAAFARAAADAGVTVEPHPAAWENGPSAGPARNAEMVAAGALFVLAVHRDLARSRGTRDCVRKALAAGLPVWLLDGEGAEPKRLAVAP